MNRTGWDASGRKVGRKEGGCGRKSQLQMPRQTGWDPSSRGGPPGPHPCGPRFSGCKPRKSDEMASRPSCALAEAAVGQSAPSGAGKEGIWTSGDPSSSIRSHDSFLIAARRPRTIPPVQATPGCVSRWQVPLSVTGLGPRPAFPPHSGGDRAQWDGGKELAHPGRPALSPHQPLPQAQRKLSTWSPAR